MAHYKVRVAYHLIETREFEFHRDLSYLSPGEILDICEEDIGFDKGKVVDREILREYLVYEDTHQVHGEK